MQQRQLVRATSNQRQRLYGQGLQVPWEAMQRSWDLRFMRRKESAPHLDKSTSSLKLAPKQLAHVAELEGIMAEQFTTNSSAKAASLGGIDTAAQIMNFANVDIESSIMSGVTDIDQELATLIQDKMLTFENMAEIDNRSMQTLLRSIEQDMLMSALRGADETTKDKFLSNMSERARDLLVDDMEAKGPIRVSEVEAAQKGIMQIARKLSDDGEIMLAGAGEAFV